MSVHDAEVTLRQIVEVCAKATELRNSMIWEEFRGDYIARGYDSVDYDVIWGVLDVEVRRLNVAVLEILAKEFPKTRYG